MKRKILYGTYRRVRVVPVEKFPLALTRLRMPLTKHHPIVSHPRNSRQRQHWKRMERQGFTNAGIVWPWLRP